MLPGDWLLQFDGGAFGPVQVDAIEAAAPTDTFDLTVEDAPEFVAGGILVHNCYSRFPGMPLDGNAADWVNLPLKHESSPAPGRIVVYGAGAGYSGYGHVAVVESGMHGNTFTVSEMNYRGVGVVDRRESTMADVVAFLDPGVPGAPGAGGISLIDLASMVLKPAQSALDGLLGALPDGLYKGIAKGVGSALMSALPDWLAANTTGGAGPSGANVSGNVAQWLTQALQLTGKPMSWLGALEIIAQHESGGNPNAVQPGTGGALGLMQTIRSTFNAYAMAGHNNIFNPVDNAIAAIRYIADRYGDPSRTPGVASIMSGGPYKGYAAGGKLAPGLAAALRGYADGGIALTPQLATLAENGPEMVTPLAQGAAGGSLLQQLVQQVQQSNRILAAIANRKPLTPTAAAMRGTGGV